MEIPGPVGVGPLGPGKESTVERPVKELIVLLFRHHVYGDLPIEVGKCLFLSVFIEHGILRHKAKRPRFSSCENPPIRTAFKFCLIHCRCFPGFNAVDKVTRSAANVPKRGEIRPLYRLQKANNQLLFHVNFR